MATMVPWWKRLIYSLVSMLIGAGVSGAAVTAREILANAHGRISATGLLIAALGFGTWVVVFSVPGWLMAIPIVLLVRNIRGWRFWMYFALGACFGPVLILGVGFYSAVRGMSFEGFPGHSMSVVYIAGAVSSLTTLLYLLWLRGAQMRLSRQPDITPV
jgi:hypothetical protein